MKKTIWTIIIGFLSINVNSVNASSLKNACEDLVYFAREGFHERPLSPQYFSDPVLEEKSPEEFIKDNISESVFEMKRMASQFIDLFKTGGASLLIGYNEGPDARLRPGIYVQRGKNWHEIPTLPMADARLYEVRPLEYNKDGSIKILHIYTFYFSDSPLPYQVILDDYDEHTHTGSPKIIVRNPAHSSRNDNRECIKASRGKLGLRVFAKNLKMSNELIVGSSFENAEDLKKAIIENKNNPILE